MALSMSNPRGGSLGRSRAANTSGAVVPLGVPVLAGPGSISSVMMEMRHGSGVVHAGAVILCVLATCTIIWLILRFAHAIGERIRRNGLDLLSRLFGVLLAAMAVKIIATGLRSLLPALP